MEHIQKLCVGEKFPGWQNPEEGAYLSVLMSGLQLLVTLAATKKDISDFKKLTEYGIYQTDAFAFGHIMWKFQNGWIVETPFNFVSERNVRDEAIESFLLNQKNSIQRFLVDRAGIIKSINFSGLHLDFIEKIKNIWGNPKINWNEYESNYEKLIEKNVDDLWSKAKIFKHEKIDS